MTVPDPARRRTLGSIVTVWAIAATIAIIVGIVAAPDARAAWLGVGLGGCVVAAFAVQLLHARPRGFIERVAASVLGAALVMGVISLGFGLAALVPG